jgi:hypothetical protein
MILARRFLFFIFGDNIYFSVVETRNNIRESPSISPECDKIFGTMAETTIPIFFSSFIH